MRPLGTIGTWRAAPRALAAFVALALSSGAAFAMCTGTAGVNIVASDGETCNALGTYTSTTVPAGQATGAGSVLTWPGGGSVSFSTSADDTPAVQADTGGSVILNVTAPYAGTVTTTGEGSIGLYATGSGSTEEGTVASSIAVENFTISTQNLGDYSIPIYATQGGQITVTGGSATSAGDSSFGAAVVGGGTINLNGTTILTTGDGAAGIIINGAGGVINATGVSITTHGNVDTSLSNYADGAYNGPYGATYPTGGTLTITNSTITTTGMYADGVVTSGGGITKLTDVMITTSGPNAQGVIAASGGVTTISGGSVTTSGDGAEGLLASGTGSGITTSSGTTISTTGLEALGVIAQGGASVTISGGSVSTTGDASKGLSVFGVGSSLTASNVTVTTSGTISTVDGFHAYGVYNGYAAGSSYASGGTATLTNVTVNTSGASSSGVVTGNSGSTTITDSSITTTGTGAYGVQSFSAGSSSLSGGSINTSGSAAFGLQASGAGSSITTTGTTIATSGTEAHGVETDTGATVTLNGGSVTVSGAGTGDFFATGSGTKITASNVALTATGGTDLATGYTSYGIDAENGASVVFSGGSITTSGASANGAQLLGSGSNVTLSGGTTILTTGNGAVGLAVIGSGATLTATGVTVTTHGSVDSSDGFIAFGAYNGSSTFPPGYPSGGTLNLTDTTVTTTGAGAIGVVTNSGGVTNISGGAVSTAGQDAHALFVTGAGSTTNLSGATAFTTQGAGAIGIYATLGGVVTATGAVTIATSGGVSLATGLGAYGVNADGAGSQINLAAATITTTGVGATALYASDAAASGAAGSITANGTLTVKTINAGAVAVGLQGNGASVLATGGGSIVSAGTAIAFMGGTNQIATFDNFSINNQTGDLIFADPSIATINFNNTVANAGANNLLNATNGSVITFNASASTLTGAIQTDSTSTTNVNFTNGTTWTMTGSSTVTNLKVTNSAVVFAPPDSGAGFKTLTVTNYVGSGANITLYAALAGANSASDKIIINGGSATGTTLLTIKNIGGGGGATTGAGIPLVVAANGGTISSDAFSLASTPTVGAFKYTLDQTNQSWYLVSSPVATVGQIADSINTVAKAQQTQIITNRVLTSILLGANEQISCSSCGSGFASIGSFAAGAHGRWGLTDELTLMGGLSYNQWNGSGVSVTNAPTVAASLVYDFWKWGPSRPFFEIGGGLTPYEDVSYSRYYPVGFAAGQGNASAIDREVAVFGRAGWVDRFSEVDEAAVYGDLGRNWMQTGGYTEMTSAVNPYPATVANGLDTLNVARLGAQYTRLFNDNIEVNVSGAVAYGFGAGSGAPVNVYGFGPIAAGALPNTAWGEYGARIGYRFNDTLVVDAFVIGTAFGEVGTTVHGGIGLRLAF